MTKEPKTLDELMAEYEPERLAEIARDEARRNTPAAQAALEAKKREEFRRGVRLGWWDADGNPLTSEDEPDEGEPDEGEDGDAE
jgi:hypothetical protein